jgi:hypothetical protein
MEPEVRATTPPPSATGQQLAQARLHRAIVSTMLVEPQRKWTPAEMERELSEHRPLDLRAALEHLAAMGVLISNRGTFSPSQCTTYLDGLKVIGI